LYWYWNSTGIDALAMCIVLVLVTKSQYFSTVLKIWSAEFKKAYFENKNKKKEIEK
jgi:hypothetical protein